MNVPILVYHHVYGDDDPELAHTTGAGVVTATALRRQVMHLLDEGWRVVATGDLVDGLVATGEDGGRKAHRQQQGQGERERRCSDAQYRHERPLI